MFLSGKIFIQCKEIKDNCNLLKLILREMLKIRNMTAEQKRELSETLCSEDELKDHLKEFFKGKCDKYELLKNGKHST